MTNNEKFFYQYWFEKLKGKTSAPTDYVLEAYKILYGKTYGESYCPSCLSGIAQEMKDKFYMIQKEIDSTSTEMETFIQKQSDLENLVNQQVKEPIKNKGGRPKKS